MNEYMIVERHYFLYMLECSNGHFYTGIALDPAARYRRHRSGLGAYYTRVFQPRRLVQCWSIKGGRGDAMKIEALVKSLSRASKEELVTRPAMLSKKVREQFDHGPKVRAVSAKRLRLFNEKGAGESVSGKEGTQRGAAGNDGNE